MPEDCNGFTLGGEPVLNVNNGQSPHHSITDVKIVYSVFYGEPESYVCADIW